MKPADVRFYVDADILGVGKILTQLRNDVTYPGDPGGVLHRRRRPACPVTGTDTDDVEWIRLAAEKGWLMITRDSAIQRRVAERRAVLEHGGRMVALAGSEARNTWAQLEVLMVQWRRIDALLAEAPPFIFSASRTAGLRAVPLG